MSKIKDVNPSTALSMIRKGALLVDVREGREVEQLAFDVPDVLVVPLSRLENRVAEIPSDRKVIVACKSGNRSQVAARILLNHGYGQVLNMQYGILGWSREGLPVKSEPKPQQFAWLRKLIGSES